MNSSKKKVGSKTEANDLRSAVLDEVVYVPVCPLCELRQGPRPLKVLEI